MSKAANPKTGDATRSTRPAEPVDVLVVDDQAALAEALAEGLTRAGYRCTVAVTGNEAVEAAETGRFDVIVTDLVLGGVTDGLAVMRAAHQANPASQVIVISAHGDIPTSFEAGRRGAFRFVEKPVDLDSLRVMVGLAVEQARRRREEIRRAADSNPPNPITPTGRKAGRAVALSTGGPWPYPGFDGVLGRSPLLLRQIQRLRRVAPTNYPVLLTGPNGAGKELFAQAVHRLSPRAGQRYVAINCAGIPETLLEDELFGHVRGTFTEAKTDREGKFEFADGGTLFLDEIGDMPFAMQAKLLRVLETGEITRLGSNETRRVDVRIVSATNQDLEQLIAERRFRSDLYWRIKGVEIRIPSLAERIDDVMLLAEHFLTEACGELGRAVPRIAPEVAELLTQYSWPGNVRQLRQTMRGLAAEHDGDEITLADLPSELTRPWPPSRAIVPFGTFSVTPTAVGFPTGVSLGTGARYVAPNVVLPKRAVMGTNDASASELAVVDVRSAFPAVPSLPSPEVLASLPVLKAEPTDEPVRDQPQPAGAVAEDWLLPDGRRPSEIDKLERELIRRTLEKFAGNRAKTARQLNMPERTLYRKLERYKLS